MKAFRELRGTKQDDAQKLIGNWLKQYTDDAISYVFTKMTAIINDPMTMQMLQNLYEAEQEEMKSFKLNIYFALCDDDDEPEELKTHRFHDINKKSKSYRDVLYDLYIAGYSKAFE